MKSKAEMAALASEFAAARDACPKSEGKRRKRILYPDGLAARAVALWRDTALSATAFARAVGVSDSAFKRWVTTAAGERDERDAFVVVAPAAEDGRTDLQPGTRPPPPLDAPPPSWEGAAVRVRETVIALPLALAPERLRAIMLAVRGGD
jgi:hypothetical protein